MNAAFVINSAPALPSTTRSARCKVAPRMAATPSRPKAAVVAGAAAPVLAVAPALAAEGTGAALGVDNALLLIPLLLVPVAFLVLFIQFGGSQDNEDFFGGYDERRN